MAFADPGHVVFGADNPSVSPDVQALFSRQIGKAPSLRPGQLEAINHRTCQVLFPRLRTDAP